MLMQKNKYVKSENNSCNAKKWIWITTDVTSRSGFRFLSPPDRTWLEKSSSLFGCIIWSQRWRHRCIHILWWCLWWWCHLLFSYLLGLWAWLRWSRFIFHNFFRFFIFFPFILWRLILPSEVVWKIQISNLRNSNVVFLDKMISNENVVNYKVL